MALGLAALTVAVTRRPKDAVPILVAGVLVDLDHLVDLAYYRLRGPGRFIAPLHGWEYVLGLLSADGGRWTTDRRPDRVSTAHGPQPTVHGLRSADYGPPSTVHGPPTRLLLAAGLAAHLALDQVHAPRNPLAYWVLYRLTRGCKWAAMDFIPGANENWKETPWWQWF